MKSRGIYETPGGTILYAAHRGIESITLDRGAGHLKDELMPKYAELIYYGFWYSPEREMLQALIDKSQENVTGTVRLKLYKGNTTVVGRKSPKSLYSMKTVTFEDDAGAYDQRDAEGFIKLNALRLQIAGNGAGWSEEVVIRGPRASGIMLMSGRDARAPIMSYFGLPYIHAVFDVAAWLASMTVFWLTTRHLIPAEALPANRVQHPGLYAVTAGAGALCGAMFFGTANALLSGMHALGFSMVGGIAGAIAAVEAYQTLHRRPRLDRHRLRRALRRHRRRRPLGLLLLRPRRFHLRHADCACPGPSISATASAAIPCSSTNRSPWRRCSSC